MRYLWFILCVMCVTAASAVEGIGAQLQMLRAAGWQLNGVKADIAWTQLDQIGLGLSIDEVILRDANLRFKNVKVSCPTGHVSALKINCPKGRIKLYFPKLQQQKTFRAALYFDLVTQRVKVSVRHLALAGGRIALVFQRRRSGHWWLKVTASNVQLAALVPLLAKFDLTLPATDFAGQMDVSARISGSDGVDAVTSKVTFSKIAATDNAVFALDGVSGVFSADVQMTGDQAFKADLTLNAGEVTLVYADDTAYKGFSRDQPGTLKVTGRGLQVPTINSVVATLPGVDRIEGHFVWDAHGKVLDSARIQLLGLSLSTVPDSVERFAEHTLSGHVSVDYTLSEGHYYAAIVTLKQISLENSETEVGFSGVSGRVLWHNRQNPVISRLGWQSGHLKKINIGPGNLVFSMKAGELKLEKAAQIPILDGRLLVDQLHFKGIGEADWQVHFVGQLLPISLLRFSEAMGWPPLAGKLSGAIPGITHEGKRYTLDGELVFNAFDGRFVVKHLVLDDILGAYPIIRADVDVALDLRLLTETFDIGAITGRLEGYIRDFVMEDGVVTEFDAKFATPEDDDSEHSISQRAVDNIANLGGSGIAGALSRSFLRFFDTFSYDRLGLSCHLHDGVCEMGGVEDSDSGYYIVKGAGIPRIDIKGFNGSVDWQTLIDELMLAIESSASVEE